MSVDEELSRALADMTRTLKPQPDPYGRIRARYRRTRRRRTTGLAMAVVVSFTGGAFAVAGPAGTPPPPPSVDSDGSFQRYLAWGEKLLQSPPRGAVAQDPDYVRTLGETLLAAQQRGEFERLTAPVRTVKVLFVDDVGGRRIALAAFVRNEPDPGTGWPNASVWLAADEGASAQELGSKAAVVQGPGDDMRPYESLAVPDSASPTPGDDAVHVAIVPDGCVFATAPVTDLNHWTDEPTRSYLVRTPQAKRAEWWRVTCAGVVREVRPGPGSLAPHGISDAQLTAALSRARGTADRDLSRMVLSTATEGWGYSVSGLPSVVWGGRITEIPTGTAGTAPATSAGSDVVPPKFDGRTTVLAAPAIGGGWLGYVEIEYDRPGPDHSGSTAVSFETRTDPADPSGVLAVPLDDDPKTLLVVTPAAATTVRAVRDGREVARAPVTGEGVVLAVPDTSLGLVVEALDGSGTLVATGTVAAVEGDHTPRETSTWD